MSEIARIIAEKVRENGGRAFFVGGFVRDKLLGTDSKDIDIEVHGLAPETLYEILKEVGEPLSYGSSFGIFSLKGLNVDIAMPRKERATGNGHRDFEVCVDPFIGTTEAARRRDFTVNALMEDVLTGEIIDPFDGEKDLKNKVIRHIDDNTFPEDPLRVLRGAQFAARLGFTIAPETVDLCREIDLSSLSRERVEFELKKGLLKGSRPSVFFEELRKMDQLGLWFPELQQLIGLEQDPKFHPEGDVWTHTMEVINRGAKHLGEVSNPYAFMMLCLTHDLGKITATEEKNGRIHAYGHETAGLPIVETFLRRVTNETEIIDYVLNMVPLHMKPNLEAFSRVSVKTTNKMFDEAAAPEDLIYFAMSDKPVFSGDVPFTGDSDFLFERLKAYEDLMSKPFVAGRDLIDAGLNPGDYFKDLLAYSHKLRLAGIPKPSALKQTLAYARKYKKD